MNPARIFVDRPVMTTLVMAGILIFGMMAYRLLPVSDLPNVDFPTIEVRASLPGANAETMAISVAKPLENEFSTISGITSMTSVSGAGSTNVTLQFELTRNIDAAAQDVQSAISSASRKLPDDMSAPPSFRKVNPAAQPILYLALSSDTLPLSDVDEYAQNVLAQRISMVSGVAQVSVFGSQKHAVRLRINPDALTSRGIGIDEVVAEVRRANVKLPTGVISGAQREFTIRSSGQLMEAQEYKRMIVAYKNGAPVRLEDVAQVFNSVEEVKRANRFNKVPAIVLAIQRQPGTNTVKIVDSIHALFPVFERQVPGSVKMEILYDRSQSIRASVEDVKFTLLLAAVLVVLVIFLFLRNLPATLIPSLTLPMCVIGTFSVMYVMDFSLNNISLMALTLSLGFVVDDAIVMLENIVRHMEMGKSRRQAIMDGSKEISFTIVSMTVSLAAVFIPVLFMGGVVGRLFHEFAVTITAAILISGFISLSLTPMLGSLILHPEHQKKHGRLYLTLEGFFEAMRSTYERTLNLALRHRFLVLLSSFAILGLTVGLFLIIPKGFLPSEDTGQIQGFTEAEQGIGFPAMLERQNKLADIIAADENVEAFMSVVGAGGPNRGGNTGRLMIRLKPRSERKLSADELIQKLRPKLNIYPGLRVVLQNPPAISIGGSSSKGLYQFSLQNTDSDELYRYAAEFERKMKDIPELQDVTSSLQLKNPEVRVAINRDRAAALGVSAYQIEDALATAYGSKEVTTIFAANNDYPVIMEVDPAFQRQPGDISKLYVRSSSGQLVPLSTLAEVKSGIGPQSIDHLGQLPSVTLSFNLKPGVSLSQAVEKVEELSRTMLPATFSTAFQGTAQAFQDSFKGLWMLLAVSIVVIYIILGILYESFIHPLTILSGLPAAGIGALLTLLLFRLDLNIYGFVGMIMLIGIVKKNAIMMIDFALEAQRKEGKSPDEAIVEGALVRFRPIMMTTMAAIMGTLPIALGFGAGAEARRPLGLAVVGGLLLSQLLTLYLTPVYYIYLDKVQQRIKRVFFKGGLSTTDS